jgi:hypothetical protein
MYNEAVKKPTATNYVSPQLLFIGKLENLTTGGSGSKRESKESKKGKGKSPRSDRRP